MYRTFNCGVGMIVALPKADVETALGLLQQAGEKAWVIGEIQPSYFPSVYHDFYRKLFLP